MGRLELPANPGPLKIAGDVAGDDATTGTDQRQDAMDVAILSYKAEGTGLEPATGFPARHFQCRR